MRVHCISFILVKKVGLYSTHSGLNKLNSHYILEESNFNFRYVRQCDLDTFREKWLNYLQTVDILIRCCRMQHLIWVCTVLITPLGVSRL